VAQIFNTLSQTFSTVEHLTFEHQEHNQSSEEHNEVDRTEWRKLLRSFSNVKSLHIDGELVGELSRCLRLEDGEYHLELLPELQELTYPGSVDVGDAFTSLIDARQNEGRTVTLIKYVNRGYRGRLFPSRTGRRAPRPGRGPAYVIQRAVCSLIARTTTHTLVYISFSRVTDPFRPHVPFSVPTLFFSD